MSKTLAFQSAKHADRLKVSFFPSDWTGKYEDMLVIVQWKIMHSQPYAML